MTDLLDVAAGAEASRRVAWAKFYATRRALARVVLDELHVAVKADDPRFVWHARDTLATIASVVPLESMVDDMAAIPSCVGRADGAADIQAQIAAFHAGMNEHGIPATPPPDWPWPDRADP